jgi:hypothetical protein
MKIRHVMTMVLGVVCLSSSAVVGGAQAARSSETLVDVVLRATDRFRNVNEATAAGYASAEACVSGPEAGAMGVHFVDGTLVGDGELDAERPEALIYEIRNGRARLVGVEYIVLVDGWHANHTTPPVLMGQQFHYVGSPNRYGSPAFYELHVWAWRQNPNGAFVDWNPRVSCDGHATDVTPHGSHH